MLTVQDIYNFIDERAPFDTQVAYDNSGLLVGDPTQEITGVHFALDVTHTVIDEAIAHGANLIVAHHPLMFSPIKRLVAGDYEAGLICRLIREGISLIAAHTNLDQASGGVNDSLAKAIGLTDVIGEGFLRIGNTLQPMTAADLASHISQRLGDVVRVMGDPERVISRVGLCSGSGSDEWQAAAAMGVQAFLTGEAKHHHALAASDAGVVLLEAGHYATEKPGIFVLASALQSWMDSVQYKVGISRSSAFAYITPVRE